MQSNTFGKLDAMDAHCLAVGSSDDPKLCLRDVSGFRNAVGVAGVDDVEGSTAAPVRSTTQRRNADKRRSAATQAEQMAELDKLSQDMDALKRENMLLKQRNNDLERQRDGERLKKVIVSGKIRKVRRDFGFGSDSDEDGFGEAGTSAAEGWAGISAEERSADDGIELRSDGDEDVCSDTSSEISPAVAGMQTQMKAIEVLLAHDGFQHTAGNGELQHLRGLLFRAQDACHIFAEAFDEHSLTKWVCTLQRAVTAAVKANLAGIQFHVGARIDGADCDSIYKIEPMPIWEAITWETRVDILDKMGGASKCQRLVRTDPTKDEDDGDEDGSSRSSLNSSVEKYC